LVYFGLQWLTLVELNDIFRLKDTFDEDISMGAVRSLCNSTPRKVSSVNKRCELSFQAGQCAAISALKLSNFICRLGNALRVYAEAQAAENDSVADFFASLQRFDVKLVKTTVQNHCRTSAALVRKIQGNGASFEDLIRILMQIG
jgi:hypothetical protein